jgi:hypothetical protein
MALEQSIVMGIALTWLFVRMINESEREEQRKERYGDPDDRPPAGPSDAALAAQARVRAAQAAQATAPTDD